MSFLTLLRDFLREADEMQRRVARVEEQLCEALVELAALQLRQNGHGVSEGDYQKLAEAALGGRLKLRDSRVVIADETSVRELSLQTLTML